LPRCSPESRRTARLGFEAIDFGSTRDGGSCNVETYTITPHCNGTHTECVGHIVDDQIYLNEVLEPSQHLAWLATVDPELASESTETYNETLQESDRLITRKVLEDSLESLATDNTNALIIRTNPNSQEKISLDYSGLIAPYFSFEAMQFIVSLEVRHLLLDIPSVDRLEDGGHMDVHHIYWQVPQASKRVSADSRTEATITETLFIADDINDGQYVVEMQIPDFKTDAAPSRIILYRPT